MYNTSIYEQLTAIGFKPTQPINLSAPPWLMRDGKPIYPWMAKPKPKKFKKTEEEAMIASLRKRVTNNESHALMM